MNKLRTDFLLILTRLTTFDFQTFSHSILILFDVIDRNQFNIFPDHFQ